MDSLPDPPTDGITSLKYLSQNASTSSKSLLASTSWDGCLRLHDTNLSTSILSHQMDSGPLMSLATIDHYVFTGGLDGSVRKLDIQTSAITYLGRHAGTEVKSTNDTTTAINTSAGCSCLATIPSYSPNIIASSGWDTNFHLWDLRTPQPKPIFSLSLPGKAFSMDSYESSCLVATSGRKICKIDIRKGKLNEDDEEGGIMEDNDNEMAGEITMERESPLKYQTRVGRFIPDGSGYAIGSVEGRVAVEFLNNPNRKNYAFKCHRSGDIIYPVNDIQFHPTYTTTFATGGCDGTVVVWDAICKKKLATLPKLASSISAMAFSPDGNELAIASSYTFEDGEREHPRDEIFVKKGMMDDCRPKQAR